VFGTLFWFLDSVFIIILLLLFFFSFFPHHPRITPLYLFFLFSFFFFSPTTHIPPPPPPPPPPFLFSSYLLSTYSFNTQISPSTLASMAHHLIRELQNGVVGRYFSDTGFPGRLRELRWASSTTSSSGP
jgi:hypothetical protein